MATTIDLLGVLRDGLPARAGERRHVVDRGRRHRRAHGRAAAQGGGAPGHASSRRATGWAGGSTRIAASPGGCTASSGRCASRASTTLGQHLIHDRFGLATTPFGMEDQDTFIHLNGRSVRRSAFTADSFDFDLPPGERGRPPAEILRDAMRPLIDLVAEPGGWEKVVERYDRYSLLGFLVERGVSEQALAAAGPALQPRGALPLLAGRVVRPLARGRLRRPRVHRRRGRHARRRVRPGAAQRHAAGRRGPRHRAAPGRRRRPLPGRASAPPDR